MEQITLAQLSDLLISYSLFDISTQKTDQTHSLTHTQIPCPAQDSSTRIVTLPSAGSETVSPANTN